MSIDRQHGAIIFECDSCTDNIETHESDFNIAWAMAKRDGWRARKVFDEWQHTCPNCNEKNDY